MPSILKNVLSSGAINIGATTFTPSTLNPSILLEAGTDNYTLDPTNISSWNATAGSNATQSVSAERPAPITITSDPFVQFDETNKEHLDLNDNFNTILTGDWTIYYIVKPDTLGVNFQFLFGELYTNPTQSHFYNYFHGDDTMYIQFNVDNNTAIAQTTTTFSTSNTYIIELNHDSTAQQMNIYINGVKDTLDVTNDGDTSALTPANWSSDRNMYLGARNNNNTDDLWGDNSMGDIIVLNRLLTAQERADLGTYYV